MFPTLNDFIVSISFLFTQTINLTAVDNSQVFLNRRPISPSLNASKMLSYESYLAVTYLWQSAVLANPK